MRYDLFAIQTCVYLVEFVDLQTPCLQINLLVFFWSWCSSDKITESERTFDLSAAELSAAKIPVINRKLFKPVTIVLG